MIDLIINIKNFIVNIFFGIIKGVKSLARLIPNFFYEIKTIKTKLANLESVNFEVADFHLKNGSINDAILRLKIIYKFISPGNQNASYKLAWCYFIKEDFKNSLLYLEKSERDVYGLKDYITSYEVDRVPEHLWQEYKNLTTRAYFDKFINKNINLHDKVVDILLQHLRVLPENCQVLDLGAFVGLNALALERRMPKKYTLTGVESSKEMVKVLQVLELYDNIQGFSIPDFLSNNTNKYDIIMALGSLSFEKDQKTHLAQISKALKSGGYFIMASKLAESTRLANNKIEFLYNKLEIEKSLSDCNFMIIESVNLVFSRANTLLLTLCKTSSALE